MLSARQINYQIGSLTLLSDVSVNVNPNTITAILGANGAGKSTLLKVLLGLKTPKSGDIQFKSQLMQNWSASELAKQRAYMAQSSQVQLNIPVYEYLSLARIHCVESTQTTLDYVECVIAQLHLGDLALKQLGSLSGGEWQRVELARAYCQLLHQQDYQGCLLVLDEPAAALDVHQTERLYKNLEQFVEKGGTVLVVEHDINLAARFCDQLILLQNGKVLTQGASHQVFTSEHINRCFDVNGEVVNSACGRYSSFIL